MRLKWKPDLVYLEIVLILTQDSCIVCAERTIGTEVILDARVGTPGDVGHVHTRFSPFGDSVIVGVR